MKKDIIVNGVKRGFYLEADTQPKHTKYVDFLLMIGESGFDKKDKSTKVKTKYFDKVWQLRGFIDADNLDEIAALDELLLDGVINEQIYNSITSS